MMRSFYLPNKNTDVLLHLSYALASDEYVYDPTHECGFRHYNTCDGRRTILDVVPHITSCLRQVYFFTDIYYRIALLELPESLLLLL